MNLFGGLSLMGESYEKQKREAGKRAHQDKMKLLRSIEESLKRKTLPEKDSFYSCLKECSKKEILDFWHCPSF